MAAFGPSLKVGEFLLPSGLMAIGPDGHVAGSEVSPGFPGLAHAGYSQAEAVYGDAEVLCRAAGTTMGRLLRAPYFVADIAAFPGIAMAWSSRYDGQPHPRLRTDPAAMDRRHFLQGSAALDGSLPTAVDRSALAEPVHIVPAVGVAARAQKAIWEAKC